MTLDVENSAGLEERILGGLDAEQRAVATSLQGPLCVLAGAGTGKTRAITHRIAYGVHSGVYTPQRLLAVTFTARAAAEMRSRLRDLGVPAVQARTFHAAALRQLQYFWPQAVGGSVPQLLDHKAGPIAEAARRLRLNVDRAAVRDLAAEIEWAKVSMLTPDNYLARAQGRGEPGGLELPAVARVFSAYEDLKSDRNLIDFEDVLLITVGILEEDAKVAATVREQYRHFVVDEYQDVSPLQERLLQLWLGGRDELCVVGDASQTIYSFTGATPRHLLDFQKSYPEAQLVRLVRDYRSTPEVVKLANTLLHSRPSGGPEADRLWARPLELIAQRPSAAEPVFLECPDDEAEAAVVAERIGELITQGTPAAEIAVLYRTNGQSEAFEQALAARDIPYQLRGGERFFQRREVREGLLQLRAASRADTSRGGAVVGTVADVLSSLGYTPEAPVGGGAVRERWESLAALVNLAQDLATVRGEEFSLNELVAELQERATAQHAPTVQGVTLASLHSAKGLEWDAVFLVGLSEGLMPISFAEEPYEVDEERRLLYVGITRARLRLCFSWSTARTPGGRAHRKPSRFLDALRPGGNGDPSPRSTAARLRKNRVKAVATQCKVCGTLLNTGPERKVGRCSDCPPSVDEQLFEALREWRLKEATDADVPAYVVFTDATLTLIAEEKPKTLEALAVLSGVGQRKLEKYGEAVLSVVAGS
ncbi:ATP-dependent DNA helicase UvrD2 [Arthrobacter sp. NPDC090010]|uniref:ATP-dependent DNA helicase UvrD2 n=1 Tax=Arthrobacter sp. NPDC090010 TaxID=3363942 RepID=UPI003815D269